jgi:hypothetical protein
MLRQIEFHPSRRTAGQREFHLERLLVDAERSRRWNAHA